MRRIFLLLLCSLILSNLTSSNGVLPWEIIKSNVSSLAWDSENSSLVYLQYSTMKQNSGLLIGLTPTTNQESLLLTKELLGPNLRVRWSPKTTKGIVIWQKEENSEESSLLIFDRRKAIVTPPLEKEVFLCWWGEDPLLASIGDISGKPAIKLLTQKKAPTTEEVFTFPSDYEVSLLFSFVVGNTFYFMGHPPSAGDRYTWSALDLEKKTLRIASEIPRGTVGALPGPDPDSVILEETNRSAGARRYSFFRKGSEPTIINLSESCDLTTGTWVNQNNYLFLDSRKTEQKKEYVIYLLSFFQNGTALTKIGTLSGFYGIDGLAVDPNLSTLWCLVQWRQVAEDIHISPGGQYSEVDEIIRVKLPALVSITQPRGNSFIWAYLVLGTATFSAFLVFLFFKKARKR